MFPTTQVLLLAGAAVNILDASLNTAQFAAQFSGIPSLGGAVGVVLAISTACQKVQSNKVEALQLQERCKCLILALNDTDYKENKGSDMPRVIEECTVHLNQILGVISRYTEWNRWEMFAKQRQISKDIRSCHTKLDDSCREFQIRSQIQIHQWTNDNKRAREEDHEQMLQLLKELKDDSDEVRQIVTETGGKVDKVLGLLQTQLRVYFVSETTRKDDHHDLERVLYNLQKVYGELPPGKELKAGEARRSSEYPVDSSRGFDIWEGTWLGQEKVTLKTIRGIQFSPEARKRFMREVMIWRKIWSIDRGRYILPFYGACFNDGPHPYIVSPWMNNGNVLQYLERFPDTDRLDIIKGIASGLSLLHNLEPKPIVHGDIKAANVLINDSGQPVLADFGLSRILEDITEVPFTQGMKDSESYRWFAPELCSAPGVSSTYSDVFAYGMTVLEIFTGEPPFKHIKKATEALLQMLKGERPRKPTDHNIIARGLDDHLWNVVAGCWEASPDCRPTVNQILARL